MSRGGNYHDNAVAERFVQLLKRERIRRKTYATRQEARNDIFDCIEMFYAPKEVPLGDNPKRRPGYNNRLSSGEYEKQYFLM
jgi:putative transposase